MTFPRCHARCMAGSQPGRLASQRVTRKHRQVIFAVDQRFLGSFVVSLSLSHSLFDTHTHINIYIYVYICDHIQRSNFCTLHSPVQSNGLQPRTFRVDLDMFRRLLLSDAYKKALYFLSGWTLARHHPKIHSRSRTPHLLVALVPNGPKPSNFSMGGSLEWDPQVRSFFFPPGVDSFSILFNHRSFQTPAVAPGFLMVSSKDPDPWNGNGRYPYICSSWFPLPKRGRLDEPSLPWAFDLCRYHHLLLRPGTARPGAGRKGDGQIEERRIWVHLYRTWLWINNFTRKTAGVSPCFHLSQPILGLPNFSPTAICAGCSKRKPQENRQLFFPRT